MRPPPDRACAVRPACTCAGRIAPHNSAAAGDTIRHVPRERHGQEQPLRRIAAVWLTLALSSVGLLGGCGSGGGAGLTQARVLAFARQVNLRDADLPGAWSIGGRAEESVERERRLSAETAACSGVPTRGDVIGVNSPSLQYGDGFVTSTVIARVGGSQPPGTSTREALAQLRVIGSRRGIACYVRIENLGHLGLASDALGSDSRLTDLANPLSGVDGSVALRFRQDYTNVSFAPSPPNTPERRKTVHRQSYIDIVTFDAGPALIQIYAFRERHPFPAAAEHRALALLYARAKAHEL